MFYVNIYIIVRLGQVPLFIIYLHPPPATVYSPRFTISHRFMFSYWAVEVVEGVDAGDRAVVR